MYGVGRSWLFVPGNQEHKIEKSTNTSADVIILDLEDSVPPAEKAQARQAVATWMGQMLRGGLSPAVRINSPEEGGLDDVDAVIGDFGPQYLLIPKVESPEDLRVIRRRLTERQGASAEPELRVGLVPVVETARGLFNIASILADCDGVEAVAFGGEDFSRSLGVTRSREGLEIMHARSVVAIASHANGLRPIDTVYSFLDDEAGFLRDAQTARKMGFSGKLAIHPSQIEPINLTFCPTPEEIAWAYAVMDAYELGVGSGLGAIRLSGAMIDMATVKNARRILSVAGSADKRLS